MSCETAYYLESVDSEEAKKAARSALEYWTKARPAAEELYVSKGRYQYEGATDLPADTVEFIKTHLEMPFRARSGCERNRLVIGFLVTEPGAPDGEWHRDVYSMAGDDSLSIPDAQAALPPHYFTLLLDLNDIVSPDQGTTVFRDVPVDAQPVRCRIFDGRRVHRGTANESESPRVMLFVAATALWYNDYTAEDLRNSKK